MQEYNPQLIEWLSTDFPRRKSLSFAWGNIESIFQSLPMLRGYWNFASVDERGYPYDLSVQGRTLTNNGPCTYGVSGGIVPYAATGAAGQYLSRLTEAGLNPSYDLTLLCWFYPNSLVALSNLNLLGKYYAVLNRKQYLCAITNANGFSYFAVSTDGINDVTVTGTSGANDTEWNFYAARYTPSTSLTVWMNPNKSSDYDQNLIGVPASLYTGVNAVEPFEVLRTNRARTLNNGSRMARVAICCASLSDTQVWAIYQLTRPYFGV